MNTYEGILVVVLSSVLALDLIITLFVLVKILKIVNNVKKIVDKAESLSEKAEQAAEFLKKSAAPVAFGRLLFNIVSNARAKRANKAKRGEDDE